MARSSPMPPAFQGRVKGIVRAVSECDPEDVAEEMPWSLHLFPAAASVLGTEDGCWHAGSRGSAEHSVPCASALKQWGSHAEERRAPREMCLYLHSSEHGTTIPTTGVLRHGQLRQAALRGLPAARMQPTGMQPGHHPTTFCHEAGLRGAWGPSAMMQAVQRLHTAVLGDVIVPLLWAVEQPAPGRQAGIVPGRHAPASPGSPAPLRPSSGRAGSPDGWVRRGKESKENQCLQPWVPQPSSVRGRQGWAGAGGR